MERFRTSQSDPSGPCRAEAFGNSLEDSVSFRFPSQQSLGRSPVLPVKSLLIASHPLEWEV